MIGSVLAERADERVWRSLPADIALARFRVVPGAHDIDVVVGSLTHRFSVTVDGPFAVMSVRQIGATAFMSMSPGLRSRTRDTQAQWRASGMDKHTATERLL